MIPPLVLEPFAAPLFKLDWADIHIDKLAAYITKWQASNPFEFRYVEMQDGRTGYKWVLDREPMNIALLIGDAIHNMRSSLDIMACEMATLNDRGPSGVYFPFGTDEAHLRSQTERQEFIKAGQAAVDLLLNDIRPHREGNAFLRALHDLDNMDKDKFILPTYHIPVIKYMEMVAGNRMTILQYCEISGQEIDYETPRGAEITKWEEPK